MVTHEREYNIIDHIFLKGYHPSINQHLITVIITSLRTPQLRFKKLMIGNEIEMKSTDYEP